MKKRTDCALDSWACGQILIYGQKSMKEDERSQRSLEPFTIQSSCNFKPLFEDWAKWSTWNWAFTWCHHPHGCSKAKLAYQT